MNESLEIPVANNAVVFTALDLNILSRINYSIGTRLPSIFSYLSGTSKHGFFTKVNQVFNEADYVLGDKINFSIANKVKVSPDVKNIVLNDGSRYRFVFTCENIKKGITLPGNGIIHEAKSNKDLRIYKIAFTKPNIINVDFEVLPNSTKSQVKSSEANLVAPVVLVVIAVAAAIAVVIGGIYGYLTLKEVHKILISPSGIILSIILLVMLFPALKSGFGKGIKSAVG